MLSLHFYIYFLSAWDSLGKVVCNSILCHRCTAEVSLEAQLKGSGYIGHPAVTDNCMQLGPITASQGTSNHEGVTRVVAGLSAFHAR